MRAVAVRADGGARLLAREPWPVFVPADASLFARELDAPAIAAALLRLLAAAEPERPRLAGVSFTGQREGLVVIDAGGRALFASPNVDARASAEGMAIVADLFHCSPDPGSLSKRCVALPLTQHLAGLTGHLRAAGAKPTVQGAAAKARNGLVFFCAWQTIESSPAYVFSACRWQRLWKPSRRHPCGSGTTRGLRPRSTRSAPAAI